MTDHEYDAVRRVALADGYTMTDLIRLATLDWLAAGEAVQPGILVLRNRTRRPPITSGGNS